MSKGHNTIGTIAARQQLRSVVERIERLEEEKKAIAEDIKEVYGEAKANGYDTKVLRQIIRLRKLDLAERQEQAAILDLYMHALGMLPDFVPAHDNDGDSEGKGDPHA